MERIRKIASIADDTPLHAAMFNCTDISHSYLIGYFTPESGVLKGFTVLTIPASTWAVFPTEELDMAKTAQQAAIMWKRIFTEWFATSGYELAPDIPEFELHYNKGNGKYVTEIYIPIVKGKGN
jgi:AraC family transcriptional regulator